VAETTRDLADYRYDGATIDLLSHADYETGGMSMYDYDLNRVLRTLFVAGIESLIIEHADYDGYHGVRFFGPRHSQ
jgi:hypothetical protein